MGLGPGAVENLAGPDVKILVTGNQAYVGPALGRHLRRAFPGAQLIGFDADLRWADTL